MRCKVDRYTYLQVIASLLVLILLQSCSQHIPKKKEILQDYDDFVASSPEKGVPSLEDTSQASSQGASENTSVSQESPRFDVAVNDVPAKLFFVSLVSEAGVNVVAHPDIKGKISLELKQVTVDEVLSVVKDVYGYEYGFSNGIYTIYPRTMRTEIYPINYLDVQRVGVTDTSVLVGNINAQSGNNNGNNQGAANQGVDDGANLLGYLENTESGGSETITPGSRVQTLNKTDFWQKLHYTLLGIIGGETEGRFVMANTQAGLVVVKALPSEHRIIQQFLQQSELSVKRQVILETKILEVQLDERFESGINWAAISGSLNLENTVSGTGSLNDILNAGRGVSEVLFTGALQVNDITKLIDLLNRQGDVSVLSSPRISTVNNQKAVIRVGSDEFFVTGISNSTTANAAAVTNAPNIELSSFFSGIALDVTPQIAADGEVILHVHPLVSNVQDQLKEIQVGSENFSLPLALRDVRESDSIVKARSGEVVVLGGLMQESSSDVSTKRSWLGNVPILNIFFKHERQRLQKTELVILMKPIVINDAQWRNYVKPYVKPYVNPDATPATSTQQ